MADVREIVDRRRLAPIALASDRGVLRKLRNHPRKLLGSGHALLRVIQGGSNFSRRATRLGNDRRVDLPPGEFADLGYIPEGMRNYLARLGWGHGDDEIISTKQAIEWFDLPGVGRSASRFDMVKLTNLNSHYVRETPDRELIPLVLPLVEKRIGGKVDSIALQRIERGMPGVKQRAHTLVELADSLLFYARHGSPAIVDDKARALLTAEARSLLGKLAGALDAQATDWGEKQVEDAIRHFAEAQGVKLGQVAQPLRVALTGSTASPGIFEVLAVLGASETKTRLQAAAG